MLDSRAFCGDGKAVVLGVHEEGAWFVENSVGGTEGSHFKFCLNSFRCVFCGRTQAWAGVCLLPLMFCLMSNLPVVPPIV